jgi:hypothetical protein
VLRTARILELLSGLAAGVVGLLTLASLLFGPTSRYIKSVTTCTNGFNSVSCTSTGLDHVTTGAIQIDLYPLSIFLLSVLALLFAVIAVSASLHSLSGDAPWQACLWTSTGLLVSLLLLTLPPQLALALAPALALAVVASGAAWIAARRRAERDERWGSVAQWLEVIGGVAAGLLGLAASAYLLTAPNQGMSGSSCDAQGVCQAIFTGSPSPLVADPVGTLFLAIAPLAYFGLLALSAVRHSHTRAPVWRAWLWGISLALLVFSLLGALSIGLLFLPSALLALLAAVSSLGSARAAHARLEPQS